MASAKAKARSFGSFRKWEDAYAFAVRLHDENRHRYGHPWRYRVRKRVRNGADLWRVFTDYGHLEDRHG